MAASTTQYSSLLAEAQALAAKGCVQAGIEILRGVVSASGVPPDIKQQCWLALSEMLEQSWIQQVAAHTYELTSFLDRFGMELIRADDGIDDSSNNYYFEATESSRTNSRPAPRVAVREPSFVTCTESRRSSSVEDEESSEASTPARQAIELACASGRTEMSRSIKQHQQLATSSFKKPSKRDVNAKRCAICQRAFGRSILRKRLHRHECILCHQTVCQVDYHDTQHTCTRCSAAYMGNKHEQSSEARAAVHPQSSHSEQDIKTPSCDDLDNNAPSPVISAPAKTASSSPNFLFTSTMLQANTTHTKSTRAQHRKEAPPTIDRHAVSEINLSRTNTFDAACTDWDREAASEVSSGPSTICIHETPIAPIPSQAASTTASSMQRKQRAPPLTKHLTRFFLRRQRR